MVLSTCLSINKETVKSYRIFHKELLKTALRPTSCANVLNQRKILSHQSTIFAITPVIQDLGDWFFVVINTYCHNFNNIQGPEPTMEDTAISSRHRSTLETVFCHSPQY